MGSNNGQRLCITKPISLGGPTDYDVMKTGELEQNLRDLNLYESQEEAVRREEVFGRLDLTVKIWVERATSPRGKCQDIYFWLLWGHGENEADWDNLFEPHAFFEEYKNYLLIDISAENADDLRNWKGWVESRLLEFTLKCWLRDILTICLSAILMQGIILMSQNLFHCSYFMGLQWKQGVRVTEDAHFDIRLTVAEFRNSVNTYAFWKPGMNINVTHVKRRSLPNFVFSGGLQPSG